MVGELAVGNEAIDLSGSGAACNSLPDTAYDHDTGYTFVSKEGFPIACGGSSVYCEKYYSETNSWSQLDNEMTRIRDFGEGVLINNNEDYWITGEYIL